MKEIQLTQGKVALVDNEDFEFLSQWKWCAKKIGNTYYAIRTERVGQRIDNKTKTIYIHREILKSKNYKNIDHADRNGLNNQKNNLRRCSNSENQANRRSAINSVSKYLGVSYDKSSKKWRAQLKKNGKHFKLGRFNMEIDAAKAYNKAALKHHAEFANLNLI